MTLSVSFLVCMMTVFSDYVCLFLFDIFCIASSFMEHPFSNEITSYSIRPLFASHKHYFLLISHLPYCTYLQTSLHHIVISTNNIILGVTYYPYN